MVGGAKHVLTMLALAVGCPALRISSGMWGPPDLAAVEKALQGILASKHLAPAQLAAAKDVSAKVHWDISILVHQNLSKSERKEKVAHAIKLLTSLEDDLAKATAAKTDSFEMKKKALQVKLEEKKSELAKDEAELKVVKLEAKLAEKKAELQALTRQSSGDQSGSEDASERSNMVAKLVNMAKQLAATHQNASAKSTAEKPVLPQLQPILTNLESRAANISAALARLDATEQKYEHQLDAAFGGKKPPITGRDDAIAKSQAMIKRLKKQEHHKFAKARAVKQNELSELNQAIAFIKQRDVAGLQKVLAKMDTETKRQTGNFIY